jgi:hypothetical protein
MSRSSRLELSSGRQPRCGFDRCHEATRNVVGMAAGSFGRGRLRADRYGLETVSFHQFAPGQVIGEGNPEQQASRVTRAADNKSYRAPVG